MMGALKEKGYEIVSDITISDIAIANTCAFIEDAKVESIDAIFNLVRLKKKNRIKGIIVAGCLPQRYKAKLKNELKEVDGFIGTGDLERIDDIIRDILSAKSSPKKRRRPHLVSKKPTFLYNHLSPRHLITPAHYAYIKIQEGCSNRCSYCVIPDIRGTLRSRHIDSVLEEARRLIATGGISELNIVGQDTTYYGYDLYKKLRIAELLRAVARLDRSKWVRLLYTHPAHYTDELIETVREEENICKYLDMPIQHISDKVLKKMKRNTTASSMRSLIQRIRKEIPGVAIRTTVLVGFPGETDEDFKELLKFVEEIRFERLGAFIYSNEEGSPSFRYKKQVPEKIRRERFDAVMSLQQKLSERYNSSLINKKIKVLIDEEDDKSKELYIGRTQYDAPSVDGEVFGRAKSLKPGDFVDVNITDTMEYDLVGEIA